MIGRRFRTLALLVAALLVLPSVVLARAAMVCSMTGQRTFSCCCASAKASAAAGSQRGSAKSGAKRADVESARCCKYDPSVGAAVSAGFKVPLELLGPALADGIDHEGIVVMPWVVPIARGWSYRGPPPSGPPLFIKHCTLLN